MIICCVYRQQCFVVSTWGDTCILVCLQAVIFWCVYRRCCFVMFTGRDILVCLQAVIVWCVYRRWCFVMFTGGDILVYLWQWCFVHLWWYSVVFTGSNVLLCLQEVIFWSVVIFCCVYRWWYFVVFTGSGSNRLQSVAVLWCRQGLLSRGWGWLGQHSQRRRELICSESCRVSVYLWLSFCWSTLSCLAWLACVSAQLFSLF